MKLNRQHIPIVIFSLLLLVSSCEDVENPPTINDEIPVIHIEKNDPISWETKEPCNFSYSVNDKTDVLSAKIKYRGGSSSKFEKKSFAVELDNKYSFQNLPNDDDWILNANYIDKTFMRHKMSYDLFRQMGNYNVAPQSGYVSVKINSIDQGLYVLMEEVNGGMVKLNKADSLAMIFKDPPVFYENKLPHVQDPANYYQQKYPNINDSDKTAYIERFKDFLFYSTDADFLNQISMWVDLENIMDWHLLLLFSNNSDGIMKNFYLYKKDTATPFRMAIWDYDHSFGRDGDNELNMMERELDCNRSVLLKRLMLIPGSVYPEKLKQRWFALRNSNIISVENINHHIRNNDKIIRNEIEKNVGIWPFDSKWYYDNNNYDEEIELMLNFTALRINQLDEYFSK